MKEGATCDISKATMKLSGLDLSHSFHDALDKAMKLIQDQAKANLAASGIKASQQLIDGIQRDVNATADEGMVYIRQNGYGNYLKKTDYRLQFLDKGTRPRYTGVKGKRNNRGLKMDAMFEKGEKKGYRGQLRATNFFQSAKNALPEAEKLLADELKKIAAKEINNGGKQ